MKLSVVLLAAGSSSRFGSNKLLADFRGQPLVCRAMEAMRACGAARCAVVTGNERIAQLAGEYGYDVIANSEPELGQSHSIHLAVRAMADTDALMLLAADQPLLTGESLMRLYAAFASEKKGIACLQDGTHRGNPAVFAGKYYPELLALAGDHGAKGLLRAHEDDLLAVRCMRENELVDCDTAQALARLAAGE